MKKILAIAFAICVFTSLQAKNSTYTVDTHGNVTVGASKISNKICDPRKPTKAELTDTDQRNFKIKTPEFSR